MVSLRRPHYAWIICLGGCPVPVRGHGDGHQRVLRVSALHHPAQRLFQRPGLLDHHHAQPLHPGRHADSESAVRPDRTASGDDPGGSAAGPVLLLLRPGRQFPPLLCRGGPHRSGLRLRRHVPLSLAVGHWFRDRRGLALGLAAAGSGVSTIFVPTLSPGSSRPTACAPPFCWRGWRCWCWGCWSFSWSGTSPATWAWSPYTWAVGDSGAAAPPRAGGHDSRPPAVPAAGCLSHRRPRRARFLPPHGALHHRRL